MTALRSSRADDRALANEDAALDGNSVDRLFIESENSMVTRLAPEDGDVVIRQKRGNPSTVYLLGTPSAPDQFILRTRDEAVSQGLAFARREHVRAWFANGDDDFVLLGTYRKENREPAR